MEIVVLRTILLPIVHISHEHRIGPSRRGCAIVDEEDKASQKLEGKEAEGDSIREETVALTFGIECADKDKCQSKCTKEALRSLSGLSIKSFSLPGIEVSTSLLYCTPQPDHLGKASERRQDRIGKHCLVGLPDTAKTNGSKQGR